MDLCTPVGPEAVGDLSEHDRGTDLAFGYVVGSRDLAVGEEYKELSSPSLDLLEQHLSCRMGNRHAHQAGEHVVGLGRVGHQSCVLQAFSSLANPDGPAQMIADFGGKSHVPAVDGILNVAQHMGEADLMLAAQFLLASVPVRDPDIGLMARQYIFGDLACPALGNLVQDGFVREEHPLPMRDAVGARCRLVRGDDPRGQQLIGDRLGRHDHAGAHAPESISNGPFGNDQAEQLMGDPRQTLEADMMAMMEIGQQRADSWSERRTRCHPGRRLGPITASTSPAATAV